MHRGGEGLDVREGLRDLFGDGPGRRELRVAEPVVADHAILVGVGDASLLQLGHGEVGALQGPFHRREEAIRDIHPADVHGKAEGRILGVELLEAGPESSFGRSHGRSRVVSGPEVQSAKLDAASGTRNPPSPEAQGLRWALRPASPGRDRFRRPVRPLNGSHRSRPVTSGMPHQPPLGVGDGENSALARGKRPRLSFSFVRSPKPLPAS